MRVAPHAGPGQRAREARGHRAANAEGFVRGVAARQEQRAAPSTTTSVSAFLFVAVLSPAASLLLLQLLLLPRRTRLHDIAGCATSVGNGDGDGPGLTQERLALRHLREFLSLPLLRKNARELFSLWFFIFHFTPLLSFSLLSPLRSAGNEKNRAAKSKKQTKRKFRPGNYRRSGPPRPSPKTPGRSATRPSSSARAPTRRSGAASRARARGACARATSSSS